MIFKILSYFLLRSTYSHCKRVGRGIVNIIVTLVVIKPLKRGEKHILLTDAIAACIEKGFRLGQILAMHPFEWDAVNQRPKTTKCSKPRKICYICNVLLNVGYFGFIVCQFVKIQLTSEASGFLKMYSYFMLWFWAMLPLNHIAFIYNGLQLPILISSWMNYIELVERAYVLKGAKTPASVKSYGWMFFGLFYGCSVAGVFIGVYYCSNLMSPDLISSIIFSPNDGNVLKLLLHGGTEEKATILFVVAFQSYLGLCWLATGHVMSFTLVPGGLILQDLLGELSLQNSRVRILKEKIRTSWACKLKVYSQLTLILRVGQDVFGFPVTYCKFVLGSFFVSTAYMMIKCEGAIALMGGIVSGVAITFLSVAYNGIAVVYSRSRDLIQDWNVQLVATPLGQRKYLAGCLGSLKPIQFYLCGGSYYVDTEMVVTMYMGFVDAIVSLLVANP